MGRLGSTKTDFLVSELSGWMRFVALATSPLSSLADIQTGASTTAGITKMSTSDVGAVRWNALREKIAQEGRHFEDHYFANLSFIGTKESFQNSSSCMARVGKAFCEVRALKLYI